MNKEKVENVAERASEEWDYKEYKSEMTGMTYNTSIPCQLKMNGSNIKQDTDKFHKKLDENGYSPIDNNPDKSVLEGDKNIHYEGQVMIQNKFHRVKVLVFREDIIRLYPLDDYVPTDNELYNLIEAISDGFNTNVSHQPIDNE